MPPDLPLVNCFGWTLGGLYLARYSGGWAGGWRGAAAAPIDRLAQGIKRRPTHRSRPPACPPADSPVGAFDECVALAGLAWDFPASCAWAARVYVNNRCGAGAVGGGGCGCGGVPVGGGSGAGGGGEGAVLLHLQRRL